MDGQADLTVLLTPFCSCVSSFHNGNPWSLVSSKLSGIWKEATAGSTVRAIKVSIIDEALEEDGIFNIKGTFEQGNDISSGYFRSWYLPRSRSLRNVVIDRTRFFFVIY